MTDPQGLSRLQIEAYRLARKPLIGCCESFPAGGAQALSQTKAKSPHFSNSTKQGSLNLEGRDTMSGQMRMTEAMSMEAALS